MGADDDDHESVEVASADDEPVELGSADDDDTRSGVPILGLRVPEDDDEVAADDEPLLVAADDEPLSVVDDGSPLDELLALSPVESDSAAMRAGPPRPPARFSSERFDAVAGSAATVGAATAESVDDAASVAESVAEALAESVAESVALVGTAVSVDDGEAEPEDEAALVDADDALPDLDLWCLPCFDEWLDEALALGTDELWCLWCLLCVDVAAPEVLAW